MGRLAEIMRKKLARLEEKLTKFSAATRSKIRTQYVDVVDPQGKLQHIQSSWIRSFAYDNFTHTLFMTVHTGKTYSWANVPVDIAALVIRGEATCGANGRGFKNGRYVGDPTGRNRWWFGKNPSLGAAYWEYLKHYQPAPYPAAPPPNPQDFMIESGIIEPKRGRPTQKRRNYERFGKVNPKLQVGGRP
jgi:hypothetical protein